MRLANSVKALYALVLALTLSSVHANDGVGVVGAGGVVTYGKSDKVSMRKEVLDIGTDRIDVSYEFINESDSAVTLPVVFPLPPYGPGMPSPSYSGQPSGFSLTIDGRREPFSTSVRAVIASNGGEPERDVTQLLLAAGLTHEQIALLPGAFFNSESDASPFQMRNTPKAKAVSKAQLEKLRALGLLELNPNSLRDLIDFPRWSVHIAYHWTATFAPGTVVSVSHSYQPFLGVGSGEPVKPSNLEDQTTMKNRYCSSDALLRQLTKAPSADDGIPGATLSYILTTANTWHGPIRDFTLRIRKSRPDEVVSLCFPGKFTKVNALLFESRMKDFSPPHDLLIKYLMPGTKAVYPYAGKHGESTVPTMRQILKAQ